MGVLLIIAAIAISGGAGVAAETRWPTKAVAWARRLLVLSLYTLVPFVVFFNLARVHFSADLGGGLVVGWVAIVAATALAWVTGERLLRLARPSTGVLICGTVVPNSGYLGYPLCASLLGFHALGEAVVYDLVVVTPSLLLIAFGTGASFGTRAGESPRERLVANGRVAAPDPEVRGGQHDGHRRLTEVVVERVSPVAVVGRRHDERDRRRRARDMTRPPPGLGELLQALALGDDDEVPALLVGRGGRAAGGLQDLVEILRRDRPVLEPPNVPAGADRVPGLHDTDDRGQPSRTTR